MNRMTPHAPAPAGDSKTLAGRLRSRAGKNLRGNRATHRRDQEHTSRPPHPRLDCMAYANPYGNGESWASLIPHTTSGASPRDTALDLAVSGSARATGREGGPFDANCA
jgi:hypothetical protein